MSTENKKLLTLDRNQGRDNTRKTQLPFILLTTLKSKDLEVFEIDEAVAIQSQTIKHMAEDGCADNATPLPNVDGPNLAKVIEYLKKHGEDKEGKKDSLKKFDKDFVDVEQDLLFDLILAANYLNIAGRLWRT
ncbi:hypothetical protein ACLB2K_017209 [Fragaria x ananassa]